MFDCSNSVCVKIHFNSEDSNSSLKENRRETNKRMDLSSFFPAKENVCVKNPLKCGADRLNMKDLSKHFSLLEDMDKNINQLVEKIRLVSRSCEALDKILEFQSNQSKAPSNQLTSYQLIQVIRTGEVLTSQKPNGIFKFENRFFIIRLSRNDHLKIYEITKLIGKGTSGLAYLLMDLRKDQEKVFKRLRHIKDKEAENKIKNECRILWEIHAKGNVWGIQAKPKAMIDKSADQPFMGYLSVKYDHDYLNDIQQQVPIEERLKEFYQLLFGLSHLERIGILHGDIKPANIFVKVIQGKKSVYLADFGGSCDSKKANSAKEVHPTAFTNYFLPKTECDLHLDNKKQKIELLQKGDIFALGCVFYMALTGKRRPFKRRKDQHPDLTTYDAKTLKECGVPDKIQTLIQSMVHPDYKQRPSAQEAFQFLDTFIQEENPTLYQQIKEQQREFSL